MGTSIKRLYELPALPYSYEALEPYISREQLRVHYEVHHRGYVDGANRLLQMMDEARREGRAFDVKAALKLLSFNIGGHVLHTIYRSPWRRPVGVVEYPEVGLGIR